MRVLKSTLRGPVRSLLGILLLALSGLLLCLCVGQYLAAEQTKANLSAQYTTVALPTDAYKVQIREDENGKKYTVVYEDQPYEILRLLDDLPERYPNIIKKVETSGLISAYCEQIRPFNSNQVIRTSSAASAASVLDDRPYDYGMFTVRLTKIGEVDLSQREVDERDLAVAKESAKAIGVDPEEYLQNMMENLAGRYVEVQLEGEILDVIALHEEMGSPVGRTLRIKMDVASEEEFEAMNLELGKTYLVYGSDYFDAEAYLRKDIAFKHPEYWDKLSMDEIRMLTKEEVEGFNENRDVDDEKLIATYTGQIDGFRFGLLLSQNDLDKINRSDLTVWSNPTAARSKLNEEKIGMSDGTEVTQREYNELYQRAAIVEIPEGETVDPEALGQLWSTAYQTVQINNHALPVVGTNNLQSMVQFAKQETFISAGRTFTQEEYANGSRVCVLSQTLAAANGLQVGDKITLQYYQHDGDLPRSMLSNSSNPVPEYYSSVTGFCSEALEYEIIGLYRQTNEWSEETYSFTPNTVFVPEQSVVGEMVYQSSGILSTFVLENGMTEKMDGELTKLGYEGLFAYYDQGYAEVSEEIVNYCTVARRVLLLGVFGWLVLLVLFALIFPARQAQDAWRMWTLGAPKAQVLGYYIKTTFCLALPGGALGSVLAVCLMPLVLEKIDQSANVSLSLSGQGMIYLLLGTVQLLCAVAAAYIMGSRTAGPLYRGEDRVRK